jgi:hypothetical protein
LPRLKRGSNWWKDLGATAIGAFIGAGIGYATAESLFPETSWQPAWINSFVAFYQGLFTMHGDIQVKVVDPDGLGTYAAQTPNFRLPTIDLKVKDVFERGEEVVLNAVFVANQAKIDFTRTDKNRLDQTINKAIRTLRQDKGASLALTGGTDAENVDSKVSGDKPYTYKELVHKRVEALKDYISTFTKSKRILRRIFDNGGLLRSPTVKGKLVD